MTDNEIIKALECCSTYGMSCKHCPAYVKVDRSNCKQVLVGALDIINRQQAEIEALIAGQETLQKYIAEAKTEAYKEFAERLKEKRFVVFDANDSKFKRVVNDEHIDNLLKEMG